MSQRQLICYMNGNIVEGPNGVSYDRQPVGAVIIPSKCTYAYLVRKLCRKYHVDTSQYLLKVFHRYPVLSRDGSITYVLIPIDCEEDMESLNGFSMDTVYIYLNLEMLDNPSQADDDNAGPSEPNDIIVAGPSEPTDNVGVGPSARTAQHMHSATDPICNPFSQIDDYIDNDEDSYESAHVNIPDEGSSDDDEEDGGDDISPRHFEAGNPDFHQAGPSAPETLPPRIVPHSYTQLCWSAIEQNTPTVAWMQDTESAWDPKQEFRTEMCFRDKKALIHAVKAYSIEVQHQYEVELSNRTVWVVNCKNGKQHCRWHLRARYIESDGIWKVVKYRGPHQCFNEADVQHPDHRNLDSNFIADKIKELINAQPNLCIAAIAADIKRTYHYTASYRKCWEAKQKAIAIAYGDWDLSYSLLPRWLQAVQHFCPGSLTDIRGFPLSTPNKALFDRAFWAFAPCLAGFMYCPPILSIDATFLYGKYKEYLLIATAVDGNCRVFPVAFAIVEKETADIWGWFLECIAPLVRNREGRITLISDRHPGILKAVKHQQRYIYSWNHRYCLRHICSNFNKEFKNASLKRMVWNAGTQAQIWKYNKWMEQIKVINDRAFTWLQKIRLEHWALAFDEGGARFGQMTTNLSESFNGVLKGIRSYPISGVAESIWYKIVRYFADRRDEPEEWGGSEFTPTTSNRLAKVEKHSGGHGVTMFDRETGQFEITTGHRNHASGDKGGNKQTVLLSQMTCTCQKWQIYHMPCSHAIAAIKKAKHRVQDYVHPCCTVAWYRSTYAPRFNTIPDQHYWPPYDGIYFIPDPERKRKIGRPITHRLRNEMDWVETPDAWCRHCQQQGHKSKHCPTRQRQ